MLSMVEAASSISDHQAPLSLINKILELGHDLLQKPIELLPGVEETLAQLQGKYRLIVSTKGDLLDQERKLKKSGLERFFHHIEIMSDKKASDYQKLLKYLDCNPENFLMLGNSLKSDVLPVLEIGGFAAHIPYHITWAHEHHPEDVQHDRFLALENINAILPYLS